MHPASGVIATPGTSKLEGQRHSESKTAFAHLDLYRPDTKLLSTVWTPIDNLKDSVGMGSTSSTCPITQALG